MIKLRYLCAFVIGFVAFVGHSSLLVVGVLFYCLLFHSQSRGESFLLATSFGLGGTLLVLLDVLGYEMPWFQLVLLYVLSAMIQGAVMAAFWHPVREKRVLCCMAASLLLLVPPFGVIHVTHPFFCFMPAARGLGYCGIVVIFAGYFVASARSSRGVWCATCVVFVFSLMLPTVDVSEVAIGFTTDNLSSEDTDEYSRIRRVQGALSEARDRAKYLLVYPEFYFGRVEPILSMVWRAERVRGSAPVLAGGVEYSDKGSYNVVLYGEEELRPVYRQRYPVPLSMWHPWRQKGNYSGHRNSRIVSLGGRESAVFVCYEALLPSAYLEGLIGGPRQMIVLSSTPWETLGHVRRLQRVIQNSTSQVFGVPGILASRKAFHVESQNG